MSDNVVDATLKRVTVPVYPTDPAKHLDYLEELRSHLHLLPGSIPGMPGFRHGILEIVGFSPLLFTAHKGILLQVFSIATC